MAPPLLLDPPLLVLDILELAVEAVYGRVLRALSVAVSCGRYLWVCAVASPFLMDPPLLLLDVLKLSADVKAVLL